jgi:uncharacterized protein (UPF0332 family)
MGDVGLSIKKPLIKAKEALKAAELCCENGLYNSCASRCYYAMFWAAIAALEWIGYPPQKWRLKQLAITVPNRDNLCKRSF